MLSGYARSDGIVNQITPRSERTAFEPLAPRHTPVTVLPDLQPRPAGVADLDDVTRLDPAVEFETTSAADGADREELPRDERQLVAQPLDYQALARAFPDPQDRDDIVTLAEHAIWSDNRVEHGEVDMIEDLMAALEIRPG